MKIHMYVYQNYHMGLYLWFLGSFSNVLSYLNDLLFSIFVIHCVYACVLNHDQAQHGFYTEEFISKFCFTCTCNFQIFLTIILLQCLIITLDCSISILWRRWWYSSPYYCCTLKLYTVLMYLHVYMYIYLYMVTHTLTYYIVIVAVYIFLLVLFVFKLCVSNLCTCMYKYILKYTVCMYSLQIFWYFDNCHGFVYCAIWHSILKTGILYAAV